MYPYIHLIRPGDWPKDLANKVTREVRLHGGGHLLRSLPQSTNVGFWRLKVASQKREKDANSSCIRSRHRNDATQHNTCPVFLRLKKETCYSLSMIAPRFERWHEYIKTSRHHSTRLEKETC